MKQVAAIRALAGCVGAVSCMGGCGHADRAWVLSKFFHVQYFA